MPGHDHIIFGPPTPIFWIGFGWDLNGAGEVVISTFSTDEHHNGLRPLKRIVAIKSMACDKKAVFGMSGRHNRRGGGA